MATNRNDVLKAGTLEGAADRLAAMKENVQREAVDREPIPVPELIEDTVEETDELGEPEEVIETELEPAQEVAPLEEADLFADDLDEAPETDTLDAPAALSKEGKELFAQSDPALQKEVSERLKAAERGATQKVQQVAEKEKELESRASEVLQMREQLAIRLQSLDATLPEPPDPDLADVTSEKYDNDEYNLQQARYQRAMRDAEVSKSERQKIVDENAELAQKQNQEFRVESARRIVGYFPSWNTQEKFTEGVGKIHKFLASEGIDPKVASQVIDADMLRISYKAMQYTEIKAADRKKRKPAAKATAPSGRGKRTQPTTSAKAARESLNKSGSLDDAVALLSATRPK